MSRKRATVRKLELLKEYAAHVGVEEINPGYPFRGLRVMSASGMVWLGGESRDQRRVTHFYMAKNHWELGVFIDGILAGMRANHLDKERSEERRVGRSGAE